MKQRFSLLITIVFILSLSACCDLKDKPSGNGGKPVTTVAPTVAPTAATTSISSTVTITEPASTPLKTPLHQQKIHYEDFKNEYFSYREICARHSIAWELEKTLDVPVYYEEEILGNVPCYHLAFDCSHILRMPGEYGNGVFQQFYNFPTDAIRMRDDGTSYLVYDTETNYRLYVFVADVPYLMGYPILINKNQILARDDFKDIQVGDSLEEVAAVDDIMELYKKELYSGYYIPVVFENRKEENNPVASVHYLQDGILRIEYAVTEEGNMVVANIEYFEDYVIPTADGKLTSHKIKDIDLPSG